MRILVFISYYLPGFKSGGPVKTLKNMVDNLDLDFYIVTLNHDINGDVYDVESNTWVEKFGSNIFYTDEVNINKKFFRKLIDEVNPDKVYINSFFDRKFSMKFVGYNIFGYIFDKNNVIISPRGEFSPGALSFKFFRKYIYIQISNLCGIYKNYKFQASNSLEEFDIKKNLLCSGVNVASDIPDRKDFHGFIKSTNEFNVIHLSRITKMKNLIFCLKVFKKCSINLTFDIYGPIEDEEYWELCCREIDQLPKNIKVNYFGELDPQNLSSIVSKYHLLFLPSLGENFCHVIAESFSCGVPVLVSDRTPWRELESSCLGWDLSLDDFESFVNVLNNFRTSSIGMLSGFEIYNNYLSYFDLNNIIDSNYRLFGNEDY